MPEGTITQFVCFRTALATPDFVSLWTPFARGYLAQGLCQIVLRKRVGESLLGEAPNFISQNDWPSSAFRDALARRQIGEGGNGTVRATQGGSFEGAGAGINEDQELLIALLKLSSGAKTPALSAEGEAWTCFDKALPLAPARCDWVLTRAVPAGEAEAVAGELMAELGPALDPDRSQIGRYELTQVVRGSTHARRSREG